MAIYVKINDAQYPASITGKLNDKDWDNRASKAILLEMNYADALSIFVDDVQWSIIREVETVVDEINEETGESTPITTTELEEYDNSEYSIAGDIIDHRNGYITVKMGKPTAEELLAMIEEAL